MGAQAGADAERWDKKMVVRRRTTVRIIAQIFFCGAVNSSPDENFKATDLRAN